MSKKKEYWMYWQKRCELAEDYIKETPCDPDITAKQEAAYKKWNIYRKLYEKGN